MTTSPIYIGVENEFQLMRGNAYLSFGSEMASLLRKSKAPVFQRSESAIRTKVGSAMYADGQEPEVCSVPVRVRKGFAQEATDALYLARKELVDLVSQDDSMNLIGYSTHWNLSQVLQSVSRAEAMRALAIPYSLLTLTPVSCGINLRHKEDGNRLELLGDYVHDEDQIRAFLLFYAGTMLNLEANIQRLPFWVKGTFDNGKYPNFTLDGRYSKVRVTPNGLEEREISAQAYLEIYYEFFRESIADIGTADDVRNLEDFVYGRRQLEVDKFKKYAIAALMKSERDLTLQYHPALSVDKSTFQSARELPTSLSKFLSTLAKQRYGKEETFDTGFPLKVNGIDWAWLQFQEGRNRYRIGDSIPVLELLAEMVLAETSPEDKAQVVREFAQLYNAEPGHLPPLARGKAEGIPISSKFKEKLHQAYRTLGLPYQAVGDRIIPEIPKERISELERKVASYDPMQDTSLNLKIEEIFKEGKREFSWRNAWSHSEPYFYGFDEGFTAGLLGILLGGILALGVSVFWDPSNPGKITKNEFSTPTLFSGEGCLAPEEAICSPAEIIGGENHE